MYIIIVLLQDIVVTCVACVVCSNFCKVAIHNSHNQSYSMPRMYIIELCWANEDKSTQNLLLIDCFRYLTWKWCICYMTKTSNTSMQFVPELFSLDISLGLVKNLMPGSYVMVGIVGWTVELHSLDKINESYTCIEQLCGCGTLSHDYCKWYVLCEMIYFKYSC